MRDSSKYLTILIDQSKLMLRGDFFASSNRISISRDGHLEFPGKVGQGKPQLYGTPIAE